MREIKDAKLIMLNAILKANNNAFVVKGEQMII